MDSARSKDGKSYSFLGEREKLRNNLEATRKAVGQISALAVQMEALLIELEAARTDALSLEEKLNRIAIQAGLEPIPVRTGKIKHDSPRS